MVLCFTIFISNINKEIYLSSIKLTSKFVCNVRFCAHGCTEPFKIKARFFFIHQSLGNAISNSLFVFNGLSSEIWAGNFRYFNDKLLAFPHTEKNFVLLLMVPDKLVPKHSVHDCVLWIDNDLGLLYISRSIRLKFSQWLIIWHFKETCIFIKIKAI